MKRRVLYFLVALSLFLTGTLSSPGLQWKTTAVSAASVPGIGDELHGFKVTDIGSDSITKATKILFTHQKTGAKLLVIKNSDKNRGFIIKFNTPAENDKGMNHIIEHAVLSGSDKYPSKDAVFDLMNTTYMSFVNGYTSQNYTSYPIASENEKQLLKATDVYLDGVFHPLVLTDKRIFEREGLRYELTSESSNLIYNGIVYNEMQGSNGSITSVAYDNAMKAIFPDSSQGNNSGGVAEDIRNLTYEELIKTYKKNYHPSNSFMVLYGDIDYEPFLKMIDGDYLSSYSKVTYEEDRGTQKPFDELQQKTYVYPAAKDTNTKNKSIIDLVFALDDIKKMGLQSYEELSAALYLLDQENSDLKKALMQSGIAESYFLGLASSTFQPTIHFFATNADPEKKKAFYDLVMMELKKTVEKGLDTELVKSQLRSYEFQEALGNGAYSVIDEMSNACSFDSWLGDSLVDEASHYKNTITKLDQNILKESIEKYIINNKFAALTVTTPEAGLLEKNQNAVNETLAEKKASMSKEEIKALVEKSKNFDIWNSKKTSEEILKSLKAVSVKDIAIEVKEPEMKEVAIDHAKLWTAEAETDSISMAQLNFDLSHLTAEELLYLQFYSDMLSYKMATENRTESQVKNEITRNAYSISSGISAIKDDKNDTSAHPVFSTSYFSFNDEYAKTFDLASDILLQSKISDMDTYGTRTISKLKEYYTDVIANPASLAAMRSMAYTSLTARYLNYLTGLDYYNFILSLEKQISSNPAEVVVKLEEVRKKAFNKNNLTILFAGDSSSREKYIASMPAFTSKLPDKTYQKAVYSLPVPAKREAITANTTVQYVSMNASLSENGAAQSGKWDVFTSALGDLFLTPEIRLKGGAYGASGYVSDNNYYAGSFKDSNYVNSMNTIRGTDEFLNTLTKTMTEESLEGYKLPVFASANTSDGVLYDAFYVLRNKYAGYSTQDRIKQLSEIRDASVADLEAYSEYLKKINDNLNYVVVASPQDIEKNKEMFDNVISLNK